MLLLIFVLLGLILSSESAILQCDFETPCDDFITDSNWGLTDGLHPQSIDHDHTLNNSSGHYLFYRPEKSPFGEIKAEIKTKDWLQISTDRATCFRMWYYTPQYTLPYTIQLVQGDDEQLTRIVASISGKDPSIDDWILINITLPAEKIKIFLRLNTSTVPLAFDDFSVDYCDAPRPLPPKTLFECDFESSCTDNFYSLPEYPYKWSMMNASDAVKIESEAPSVDFTFGNQSGHYALVPNSKIAEKGNVGYFALQTSFNITANESFCLNFQYYGYGQRLKSDLKVYAWISDASKTIQLLWPQQGSNPYAYPTNHWTWGIVNLPMGYYSLLFRVGTTDNYPTSFAVDNISIISCDYSPSTFSDDGGLLSFSCDFDNLTMCVMENEDRFSIPTYNFTVVTGETVPDQKLGPFRDHTNNSTTGGFIYWDRELPFTGGDTGNVHSSKPVEENFGMCIRFAYYVKSSINNRNATMLGITAGGCFGTTLWSLSLDDSQGWQVVLLPTPAYTCMITYYFGVYQQQPVAVSVAFDDIEIGQCDTISPTTTTSSTTTTTTAVTTRSTTQAVTTRSTTQVVTTSSSFSTTITSSPSTSTLNNAQRLLSLNGFNLTMLYFLLKLVGQFF